MIKVIALIAAGLFALMLLPVFLLMAIPALIAGSSALFGFLSGLLVVGLVIGIIVVSLWIIFSLFGLLFEAVFYGVFAFAWLALALIAFIFSPLFLIPAMFIGFLWLIFRSAQPPIQPNTPQTLQHP